MTIKCKIDGKRRDLELSPVGTSNGRFLNDGVWYSYRTVDHFMVVDLPLAPDSLATYAGKIKTSGHIFEFGPQIKDKDED